MLKAVAPILIAFVALVALPTPATATEGEDAVLNPYACHRVYLNVAQQPGVYVCPPTTS